MSGRPSLRSNGGCGKNDALYWVEGKTSHIADNLEQDDLHAFMSTAELLYRMQASLQPLSHGGVGGDHHANGATSVNGGDGRSRNVTNNNGQATGGHEALHSQYRGHPQQQAPSQDYPASSSYYASRDHSNSNSNSNTGPARRPSGIALPTYQALAHDPVYMAARTSPIGPPPRAALPALPPVPSGSGSGSSSSSRGPAISSHPSGMLAMASESRPVTAVFNGSEAWNHPSPTNDSQQQGAPTYAAVNGGNNSQHRSQERARHGSTSASRQQQQQQSQRYGHNEDRQYPHQHKVSSPSVSRHARNGTNASSTSSPPPGATAQAERTEGDGEGGPERMASKTVLTIALKEAQKAVQLDGDEQAEAALASYTKSVELLEEVMRRVTENAGTYRQKELDRLAQIRKERMARWLQWRIEQYRRAGVDVTPEEIEVNDEEIETREERRDREKREARIARRDRMRVEECEKLRVIHDTYAERIQALREELAAEGRSQAPTDDTKSQQPGSEPEARRQLEGLAISSNQGFSPSQPYPAGPSSTPAKTRHGTVRSIDQSMDSAARSHIGSAMLANSPMSPTFPQSSTSASTSAASSSRLRSSAVPFPASPTNSSQNEARRSYISTTSASPPSLALPEIHPFSFSPANSSSGRSTNSDMQASQSSPRTQQHSMLSFSPDSEKAENLQFSDQQQRSPEFITSKTHRKNASSSASFSSMHAAQQSQHTIGDLAAQTARRQPSPKPPNMASQHEQDEQDVPGGLATPTPDTANMKTFGTPPSGPGYRKVQASEGTRSRASSRASNALRHMTSSESLASTTTSSSAGGGQWSSTAPNMPLPPVPAVPQGASVSPPIAPGSAGSRTSVVGATRPLRSASLAAGQAGSERSGQPSSQNNLSSSTSSENQRTQALLINPSTLHGTISQRRKSPQMPDNATFPGSDADNQSGFNVPPSENHPGMSTLALTRTSSTERATSSRNTAYKGTVGPAGSSQAAVGPSGPQPFNVAGSLPMRLRALSQPGKRPGMPSFHSDFGQPVPALPGAATAAPAMQRADSDPLAGSNVSDHPPPTPVMPSTPMSFDYPASMEDSIYNVPGISVGNDEAGDQAISPTSVPPGSLSRTSTNHSASFLEPDTPASAIFQQTSQTSTKGPIVEYQAPPPDAMRLPFHFMRQIRASILSGAYLTPRLYIPKQLWGQPSMKLVHTETKVRMLDLLLNGLESIERTGDVLLLDGQVKAGNAGSKIDAANRLMRELESFEGMLDGIQSTLAKKLTYVEQPNGKKGGGGSFGAWSSKISRSMDRMTKGKNLDAPETYVAAIARLCLHAQILDRHLASLHHGSSGDMNGKGFNGGTRPSQEFRFGGTSSSSASTVLSPSTPGIASSGYNDIPADRRVYIETRLKRSSDFFSKVICKMFLNDLGIWLDKYSKRAAGWTTD